MAQLAQLQFVATRQRALSTAHYKIFSAPDDSSVIVTGHLVIEALLHVFIRSKLPQPGVIESANPRFYQVLCLAQALNDKSKDEAWLWKALEQLNQIRNRLSHDIHVHDLTNRIQHIQMRRPPY